MSLTKADLVDSVFNTTGVKKSEVSKAVDALLEVIKEALESGDDVLISSLGKFQVKQKAKRKGRNPATGTDMIWAPRKVVTFKCSGKLRKRIN